MPKYERGDVDPGFRRMVRMSTVMKDLDRPMATLRELYTKGDFPKPVRIGKRALAFYADEIAAWQAKLPRTVETDDGSDEGEPAGESTAETPAAA